MRRLLISSYIFPPPVPTRPIRGEGIRLQSSLLGRRAAYIRSAPSLVRDLKKLLRFSPKAESDIAVAAQKNTMFLKESIL